MAKSKLSEFKEDYYFFTGKLSDINRQIAFAGIALIWVFKKGENTEFQIDNELILPAIFIVGALAFDMFQYIYQSVVWSIFYTRKNRKNKSEDKKIKSPEYLNYPSWVFFFIKVILVLIAYWKIFDYLLDKFLK
ncbi:hypothetical protein HNV10_16605 [Winogradskyella litoriviva]|uniref:Uncharacterized protein n=1 Tax=Winogradskyella litoriviva TaxID=1220182 RepID=A0ABX2EB81_9FLAO|nr:hypothetical protein [Winogradskyella litoriviva]NRD24877.1 hypothetical protein [Winogradskyella litoriviva]